MRRGWTAVAGNLFAATVILSVFQLFPLAVTGFEKQWLEYMLKIINAQ